MRPSRLRELPELSTIVSLPGFATRLTAVPSRSACAICSPRGASASSRRVAPSTKPSTASEGGDKKAGGEPATMAPPGNTLAELLRERDNDALRPANVG